jgi:hypothetical protein
MAQSKIDMSGYKEVAERIQDFRKQYPEGTLQSELIPSPIEGMVVVKAYAYRHPDDPRPGIGLAAEPVPGLTPYTRNSEVQNAETSAWGRAIIAVGASDAKKVASANEVRNRRAEQSAPPASGPDAATVTLMEELLAQAEDLVDTKKARTFGMQSEQNAQATIAKLRKVIAEAG